MISEKIKKILICPNCKKKLEGNDGSFFCYHCRKRYNIINEKIYFLEPNVRFKRKDWLDELKGKLKKNQKLYELLIKIISPVYIDYPRKLKKWLKRFNKQEIIINIGSGPSRIKDVFSLDVFDYKEVDIVANASNLPFENNSIDGIINLAVLEHVNQPTKLVNEFHRVLKKKGKIFVFVPFLQGYHASPNDYYRWTNEGLKELFKNFEKIKIIVAEGPTSSFLWIFQEWFAITFSFYNKNLYKLLILLIMAITFPIKYLDFFLRRHPFAKQISSGFYVIARK